MGVCRVAAAAGVLAVLVSPAPAQARSRHVCDRPPAAAVPVALGQAYQDRLYDPDRFTPLATGAGVRVAVIDSGVDATHPLLRGKVSPGRDLLHGDPDGRQDCVGHGTAVAGIIAAGRASGKSRPGNDSEKSGMCGLAPDVRIVPVRVSEQERIGDQVDGTPGGPGAFARAIAWAADPAGGHAQVINLSLVTSVDDYRVRRAVAAAIAAGVVVVAAAGNDAQQGNPRPYPAAYPGVIGVGAVDAGGVRAAYSQQGDYVDLVAAGDRITVPVPGGGYALGQGTSYAAPFVSATAALVLQRFPGLSPAQVARRLTATADPAPGGARSGGYGYGLLNPYRALTESLGDDRPAAAAPVSSPAPDPAVQAEQARRAAARESALTLAGVGGGAAALAGLLAAVVRRGRRRGWLPG